MYNNLRFTDNVDLVLQNAGGIALQYGSYAIDSEHILYGLTVINDSVASKILANFGVTSETLITLFSKLFKGSSTIISRNVDVTIDTKECLLVASQFASQIGHDFVGTEHLLIALLLGENYNSTSILKRNFKVNINDIRNNVLQIIKSNSSVKSSESNIFMGGGMSQQEDYSSTTPRNDYQGGIPEFIKSMGRDLTQKAKDGKIDPIIGRLEEIERMIEILCRKNKNNPVLIGEAGGG
jgi:ATP-dependent Clp protease ATP-binding subunit ClpC